MASPCEYEPAVNALRISVLSSGCTPCRRSPDAGAPSGHPQAFRRHTAPRSFACLQDAAAERSHRGTGSSADTRSGPDSANARPRHADPDTKHLADHAAAPVLDAQGLDQRHFHVALAHPLDVASGINSSSRVERVPSACSQTDSKGSTVLRTCPPARSCLRPDALTRDQGVGRAPPRWPSAGSVAPHGGRFPEGIVARDQIGVRNLLHRLTWWYSSGHGVAALSGVSPRAPLWIVVFRGLHHRSLYRKFMIHLLIKSTPKLVELREAVSQS